MCQRKSLAFGSYEPNGNVYNIRVVCVRLIAETALLFHYEGYVKQQIIVSTKLIKDVFELNDTNVGRIKHLRSALGVGLKEAKDIYDYIVANFKT